LYWEATLPDSTFVAFQKLFCFRFSSFSSIVFNAPAVSRACAPFSAPACISSTPDGRSRPPLANWTFCKAFVALSYWPEISSVAFAFIAALAEVRIASRVVDHRLEPVLQEIQDAGLLPELLLKDLHELALELHTLHFGLLGDLVALAA
jgi:hypothetical protein